MEHLNTAAQVVLRKGDAAPEIEFSQPMEDFLDSLLFAICGARRDNDYSSWKEFGDVTVCWKSRPDGNRHDEGWRRWFMPSLDGRVRGLADRSSGYTMFTSPDKDAPWLSMSTTGALIWHDREGYRRITFSELLQLVFELRQSIFLIGPIKCRAYSEHCDAELARLEASTSEDAS